MEDADGDLGKMVIVLEKEKEDNLGQFIVNYMCPWKKEIDPN